MATVLAILFVTGWIAAALIGTLAYFRGEQVKPIHERNWRSAAFEQLAKNITGTGIDYETRTPSRSLDLYGSSNMPG